MSLGEGDQQPAEPVGGWMRWQRRVVAILAGLFTTGSVLWAFDVYRSVFGLLLYNQQIIIALVGFALALVYLHVAANGKRREDAVPWYDALALLLGLAACGYAAVEYRTLFSSMAYLPVDGIVVASIISLLVLEGLRRTAGLVLVAIVLVFMAYALLGDYLPGALQGRPVDARDLILYQTLDTHGLVGQIVGITLTIVVAFILFGTLLTQLGGSQFFTELAIALMGRFRGGSAKIAVVASALFGSISGSAVANVASTGIITIPMMRREGYSGAAAGGIEAVASTGGQLTPPIMGAAVFLMAEFLEIPYAELMVAAIIPALLYYLAIFIQVDLEAARTGLRAVERRDVVPLRSVLKAGWYFPIPFVVLIGGMFWLNMTPAKAAMYGAATLIVMGLVFGYRGSRVSLRTLLGSLSQTGLAVMDIVMIAAAASFIIALLDISGLGFALTLVLVKLGEGNLFLLLALAAVTSIVLGMGMPTIGVYVLLASLVAPALTKVGIEPLAAHLFILYFGIMSLITPPIAIAAYAAAVIADAKPIATAMAAMRFGWTAYIVPFLFVLSPELLMRGALPDILLAVATALGGVWLVSVGFMGYFRRPLALVARVLFALAGLGMLIPATAFDGAIWLDASGFVLGLLVVGRELLVGVPERKAEVDPAPGESPA